MKRIIFNVTVGLLSFVFATTLTTFFNFGFKHNVSPEEIISPVRIETTPLDWKRVYFKEAFLYLPPNMERRDRNRGRIYESDNMILFDQNIYPNEVQNFYMNSMLKEEHVWIDGSEGRIYTSYQEFNHGIAYYSAVLVLKSDFPSETNNFGFTLVIACDREEFLEDAKKIFRSVRRMDGLPIPKKSNIN